MSQRTLFMSKRCVMVELAAAGLLAAGVATSAHAAVVINEDFEALGAAGTANTTLQAGSDYTDAAAGANLVIHGAGAANAGMASIQNTGSNGSSYSYLVTDSTDTRYTQTGFSFDPQSGGDLTIDCQVQAGPSAPSVRQQWGLNASTGFGTFVSGTYVLNSGDPTYWPTSTGVHSLGVNTFATMAADQWYHFQVVLHWDPVANMYTSEDASVMNPADDTPFYTTTSNSLTGGGFASVNSFWLYDTITPGTNDTVAFDNFKVSIVPEPASLGLLALAGVAGLFRRRRAS